MSKADLKPLIKSEYLYLKSEKEKMLLTFPTEDISKETLKTIDAKLFIYSGLYNNNKTDYDRGIKKFKKSTIKSLEITADVGCIIKDEDESVELNNSEAVRQLGIALKEQYDELIMLGNIFFE